MMKTVIVLAMLLLTACGGGGSSQPATVAPPPTLTVMTMGDSITAGTIGIPGGNYFEPKDNWVQILRNDTSLSVENVAVPGNMITDVYANQLPKAVASRPKVVTLWVGVNDAGRMTPEAYQAQLDATVAMLQQIGCRVIIISALWNGNIPQIDAVNKAQVEVAAFRKVQRVDLYPLMQPDWWCGWPDVHPCKSAQPAIAKAVLTAIKD